MNRVLQRARRRRIRRESGFTLIELLVVIAVLGLLATFVLVNTSGIFARSQREKAKADINTFMMAVSQYKMDHGGRPPENLQELLQPNDLGYPYIEGTTVPQDPWGFEYNLILGSQFGDYEIVCYGADGAQGGDGEAADISSKDLQERGRKQGF